ncbi:MAG: S-methyl-5'-thioadenosine phosphorylase [Phycisphaerae bacterium]|nr:S-methyl-5'-thioadenosine phosphorylase [Phycisphaerae bacterium]
MIGIIGGTGLGAALSASQTGEAIELDTPFGRPSGPFLRAKWENADVVFLNRHGDGHLLNPSAVPYRANLFGLKMLGVDTVIASGATGSLRDEMAPGHLVVCDQVIDKTFRRPGTFFDEGLVAHVEFAEPFCPALRRVILSVADSVSTTVHPRGTYVCMEGPQFSTRAESHMHRGWGGDLIGMTCMPEAKLAREAEMAYALIALPTDYDCWRPHKGGDRQKLLEEILGNLKRATDNAIALIQAAVAKLAREPIADCEAWHALELGIWSDRNKVNPAVAKRLAPLLGRHFARS